MVKWFFLGLVVLSALGLTGYSLTKTLFNPTRVATGMAKDVVKDILPFDTKKDKKDGREKPDKERK